MEISEVRMRFPNLFEKGRVGWVSCVVNGIRLDNILVRRTEADRLTLEFPVRFSKSGDKHFYFEPADAETRRALEEAILGRLPPHWAREEGRADP
jgi:hypothetical protein